MTLPWANISALRIQRVRDRGRARTDRDSPIRVRRYPEPDRARYRHGWRGKRQALPSAGRGTGGARGLEKGFWATSHPKAKPIFNPQGPPRPVGSFVPNGFGLHDMCGSMWSWCEECYDQVVKEDRATICYDDTQIRDVRLNAICRGGSFKTPDPVVLQCAYRHEDPIDGRFDCIGFRLAFTI
jgi:formylglycine-generating enzyme required for sulfatase activity